MNCEKLYKNQPSVIKEQADISGCLCMCSDKLSWDEYIEKADIGDIVVFSQAGAYCYSLGILEFLSHPYPNEIIIKDEFKINHKGLVFCKASREDITGIEIIEKEHFADYSRVLSYHDFEMWFEHNGDMLYIVKNENNEIIAFSMLMPIKKGLYDKLMIGEVSDVFNFTADEVKTNFQSDYFFVEEVCVSEKYGRLKFYAAASMLIAGMANILMKQGAKRVVASPITERGKKVIENMDFSLVAEEEYQGNKYAICELEVTPEKYNQLSKRVKRFIE